MHKTMVAIGFLGSLNVAHAELSMSDKHFACPQYGTVEERVPGEVHYQGASPKDPYVCTRLDYSNRPVSLLFNFFGIQNNTDDTVRVAMLALLSGKQQTATFDQVTNNRFLHHETWTYLRREPLKVGAQTFDTIVLEQDDNQSEHGNLLHQVVDHWLDPEHGLWLKRVRTRVLAGQVTGSAAAAEVISVTFPP
jgi:hypothetical protein